MYDPIGNEVYAAYRRYEVRKQALERDLRNLAREASRRDVAPRTTPPRGVRQRCGALLIRAGERLAGPSVRRASPA